MANTGNKAYTTLKKVTDDGTNRPLDANDNLCTDSGLSQAVKNNISSDPAYIPVVLDTVACPLPEPDHNLLFRDFDNLKISLEYPETSQVGYNTSVYFDETGTGYDRNAVGNAQNQSGRSNQAIIGGVYTDFNIDDRKLPNNSVSDAAAFLWNTSIGFVYPGRPKKVREQIIVSFINFTNNVPTATNIITVYIRFGLDISNPIVDFPDNVKMVLTSYKGGTMYKVPGDTSLSPQVRVTQDGRVMDTFTLPWNRARVNVANGPDGGTLFGVMKYNKVTKKGVFIPGEYIDQGVQVNINVTVAGENVFNYSYNIYDQTLGRIVYGQTKTIPHDFFWLIPGHVYDVYVRADANADASMSCDIEASTNSGEVLGYDYKASSYVQLHTSFTVPAGSTYINLQVTLDS